MAQPAVSVSGFAGWLQETAGRAGVSTSGQLQRVLVRQGMDVSEQTVDRWWKGRHVPPGGQQQTVIGALHRAYPDLDVWTSYTAYMRDNGFRLTPRGAGGNVLRLRPS